MSLRDENVAKCMETIRDFNSSVQVGDAALMEKKQDAERALDHLNNLMSASPGPSNPGGECKDEAASC